MSRRRGAALALVLVASLGLVTWFGLRARGTRPTKHVFVNETSDTRFDESIKVSIFAAHRRTGVTNAVVISDRFEPKTIDREAAALFERLQLGRANGGRAILYLFSPAQKVLRIEVGYALEGALPDADVRLYEAAAKTFTFVDRYQDFWAELINTINIQIESADTPGAKVAEAENVDASKFRFLSGGAGVRAADFATSPEQFAREARALPAADGGAFAPAADPTETLDRYLESLHQGIGAADLGLLSPESRAFRHFTPQTAAQLFRNWRMYRRAGLERLIDLGDQAIAVYRPGVPVLPIVLERRDGRWFVDEPRAWALFQRFEDSNAVFFKFPLVLEDLSASHYLFKRFGAPLYARPEVDLRHRPPSTQPLEFYYFNYFWLERARAALPPVANEMTEPHLWIARDVFTNLGRVTEFLRVMDELVRRNPGRQKVRADRDFYRTAYRFGDDWITAL